MAALKAKITHSKRPFPSKRLNDTYNGGDVDSSAVISSQDDDGASVLREIFVTLPLPPSLNRYLRMVGNRVLLSKAAREYKAEVGWLLKAQGVNEVMAGAVVLEVWVFRAQRRGDLDNFFKLICDSIEGVVFENDSQVVEIHAYRDDDRDNPRVELRIREVQR